VTLATVSTLTLLSSAAPNTSSAKSCVTSSATSCAASFTGLSLTCPSFTCHLQTCVGAHVCSAVVLSSQITMDKINTFQHALHPILCGAWVPLLEECACHDEHLQQYLEEKVVVVVVVAAVVVVVRGEKLAFGAQTFRTI